MDGTKTVVSKSSTSMTLSRVRNQVKLKKCTVFELKSFTKYSILKNPNHKCLYANNNHFVWMQCGDNVTKDFVQSQIKMAEQNIGKEIMLKDIGQRNCSTQCRQKDLKQVRCVKAVDTGIEKNTCNMVSIDYLQESHLSNDSCVWLLTCLAMHSIDPTLTENILRMFIKIKQGLID